MDHCHICHGREPEGHVILLAMTTTSLNPITAIPAAAPEDALRHFENRLTVETDCADVHAALEVDGSGFVVLDVRSREMFDRGHVPGSVSLPKAEIDAARLNEYPPETIFVVYCAGPHCNGANRAAIRIAGLGRPVKEMIGGAVGWIDEGFTLERS